VARRPWSHYAAPAAFLLAVTIAVLVIRTALRSDEGAATTGATTTVTQPATTAATPPATTATRPATTASTTTTPAAGAQYYTVVAGDTFGVISTKTGVPVATIEELNPTAQSTSLRIGQKIRIK
jgi:LysM repeat protein